VHAARSERVAGTGLWRTRRLPYTGIVALAASLTLLCTAGPVAASSYCVPQNTQFDPLDVPPGGSALIRKPRITRSVVGVEGIRTPVLSTGPSRSQEAVVFVHGSPGSSQDWLDLLGRVGALGRRAVAFDMPGYGHAGKPWDNELTLAAGARFLNRLFVKLRVARVHLVVQDLGGASALEWSKGHPSRLVSAVMIDSGLLGYKEHQLAQISRTPELGEAFWQSMNRGSWNAGMQSGQQDRPLPPAFVNRLYDDLDRATRCTIIRVYRTYTERQINDFGRAQANVLSRRRRPAMIIWGRNDPYLPASMAVRQREVFPGAAIHIFDRSGHWPFVDDAQRTAALIIPFVHCLPTGKPDRIRLAVSPRRVRADRRVTLRFRATVPAAATSRSVCAARVSIGRRSVITDDHGKAHLTVMLSAGRYRVRADKRGLLSGETAVTATAPGDATAHGDRDDD
jgi:pimeloyl-ACP methyl ester carboxylesterase